jgi:hypothetical protein
MRDHAEVGDFDAPGAGRSRQLRAPAEVPMGAGHPAACVFGIAQATKHAPRFSGEPAFGRSRAPARAPASTRQSFRAEAEIAPQVVDPRALRREVVGSRRVAALSSIAKASSKRSVTREASSELSQRSTSLDVNISDCQGLLKSSNRF